MSPSPPPVTADLLLSHAAFLRRLARTLIADEHLADDVVQQTWLAAFEKPPRSEGALRAWLSRVARSVATQIGRRERQRPRVERLSAPREGVPSTDAVVQRLTLERKLVEAVLNLPEPYRTTVMLRYFDDLPPREVARRLGEPIETVKSRQKRALQRLRSELEHEVGEDHRSLGSALLAIAGWSPAPAAVTVAGVAGATGGAEVIAATGAGALLMSAQAKIAVAVGILIIAAGVTWTLLPEARETGARTEQASFPDKREAQAVEPISAGQSLVTQPRSGPAREAVTPMADTDLLLYGILLDEERRTVDEASLTLSPGSGTAPEIAIPRTFSASRGCYVFAHLEPGVWTLAVTAKGYCDLSGEVTVAAAPVHQRLDLTLKRALLVRIRLVDTDGKPLSSLLEDRTVSIVATEGPPGDRLPMSSRSSHSGYGIGRFRDDTVSPRFSKIVDPEGYAGALELQKLPAYVSVARKHVVLTTEQVLKPVDELTLRVPLEKMRMSSSAVRLRVVDARGNVLEHAEASIADISGGGFVKTRGADGSIVFSAVDPGLMGLSITIRRGATDLGILYKEFIRVEPGRDLDLGDLVFETEATVKGKVVDRAGRPFPSSVWYRNLDRMKVPQPLHPHELHATHPDGRFELSGFMQGRHVFFATPDYRPDPWLACAPVVVDIRGSHEILIELRPGTKVQLRSDVDRSHVAYYVVENAAGIPVWCTEATEPLSRSLQLIPGSYTLTVSDENDVLLRRPFTVESKDVVLDATPEEWRESSLARSTLTLVPSSAAAQSLAASERDAADSLLDDAMGLVVYGAMTDQSGNSVQASSITLRDESGNERKFHAWTEAAEYAITGLRAGLWQRSVKARGCVEIRDSIEVVAAPRFQRFDLTLSPTTQVFVKLIAPDGRPLEEALRAKPGGITWTLLQAIATEAPPGDELEDRAQAGRLGRVGFEDHTYGILELQKPPPVYVSVVHEGRVLETQLITDATSDVVITVPLGKVQEPKCQVRLKLVDAETGESLSPRQISISNQRMATVSESFVRDSSGFIVIDSVPSARGRPCQLNFWVSGYEWLQCEVETDPPRMIDLGSVTLRRERHIKGLVVDESDRPIARCSFKVHDLDLETVSGLKRLPISSQTLADGSFDVACGEGSYLIVFNEPDRACVAVEVDTYSGDASDLRITVPEGVPVTITADSGKTGELRLELYDDAGQRLGTRTLRQRREWQLRLVPGGYTVTVEEAGSARRPIDFQVGEEPVTVPLSR
ncbi:MAG: sigma-70 family RNA polymerase sigma factor [Planctomycetota bacterium]